MIAMPQLQEIPALPEIPPLAFDETYSPAQQEEIEENLQAIETELVRTEQIVSEVNQFVTWVVQLDLEADKSPTMSEEHVAFFLGIISKLAEFEADMDHLFNLWDEAVDDRGKWRGTGKLNQSHAKRTKKINSRYRKMSKNVKKLSSHQRSDLIANLLVQVARQRELTKEEKIQLLHTIPDHRPIDNPISMRRADWYGDDA